MKRIILALVMVFTLVLSASAGTIVVDGWSYNEDTLNKDSRIYVPVRFVAEKLGYKVDWLNGTVIIEKKTETKASQIPKIIGDDYFKAAINLALQKLAQQDRLDYLLICQYVPAIQQMEDLKSLKDGYDTAATTDNQTRITCISKKFMSESRCTVPVLAGLLVHEATHAAYFEFGYMDVKEMERQAYNREITALTLLDADEKYIQDTKAVLQDYIQ